VILLDYIASIFLLLSAITAHQFQIKTWLYGIISCVAYFIIFFNNHLYADMILQVFYIIFSVFGFLAWSAHKSLNKYNITESMIRAKDLKKMYITYFEFAFISIPIIGYLLSKTNDPLPYIDSMLFIFSIIATIMLTMKDENSWLVWMFVNAIYFVIFGQRELFSSSFIYLILFINAFYGYYKWDKIQKD
jgi:nicotinamide mononucleotide transporter